MTEPTTQIAKAKQPRRMARDPKTEASTIASPAPKSATTAKPNTKVSQVLDLLQRREGATLDQLVEATGWLPHTTRAALTGLKKKGHAVTSDRAEGEARVYRVVTTIAAGATV